jgi:hypothetical protein
VNGTSEANIGVSGGNANISIGGTSNVVVYATTGEFVTGLIVPQATLLAQISTLAAQQVPRAMSQQATLSLVVQL